MREAGNFGVEQILPRQGPPAFAPFLQQLPQLFDIARAWESPRYPDDGDSQILSGPFHIHSPSQVLECGIRPFGQAASWATLGLASRSAIERSRCSCVFDSRKQAHLRRESPPSSKNRRAHPPAHVPAAAPDLRKMPLERRTWGQVISAGDKRTARDARTFGSICARSLGREACWATSGAGVSTMLEG